MDKINKTLTTSPQSANIGAAKFDMQKDLNMLKIITSQPTSIDMVVEDQVSKKAATQASSVITKQPKNVVSATELKKYPVYASVQVVKEHLEEVIRLMQDQKRALNAEYNLILASMKDLSKNNKKENQEKLDDLAAQSSDLESRIDKSIEVVQRYQKELNNPNLSQLTLKQIWGGVLVVTTIVAAAAGVYRGALDHVIGFKDGAAEEIMQAHKAYNNLATGQQRAATAASLTGALAGLYFVTFKSFKVLALTYWAITQCCRDYDDNLLPSSKSTRKAVIEAQGLLDTETGEYKKFMKEIKGHFEEFGYYFTAEQFQQFYDPANMESNYNQLESAYKQIMRAAQQSVQKISKGDDRNSEQKTLAANHITSTFNDRYQAKTSDTNLRNRNRF